MFRAIISPILRSTRLCLQHDAAGWCHQPGALLVRYFWKKRARNLHAFLYPDLNNSVLTIEQSFDVGLLVDFPENLQYIFTRQDISVREITFKIIKFKYEISVTRFIVSFSKYSCITNVVFLRDHTRLYKRCCNCYIYVLTYLLHGAESFLRS